jgi:hypothetical protein
MDYGSRNGKTIKKAKEKTISTTKTKATLATQEKICQTLQLGSYLMGIKKT